MFASALYRRSPVRIQEALISLRAFARTRLREGRSFENLCREVEATQYYSRARLDEYRRDRLHDLLAHSAAHVPYFRSNFAARDLDTATENAFEVVSHLPLLDKTAVRNAATTLISDIAPRPLFEGSTSGTSGAPLRLVQDLLAINRENAFIWRQLKWAGYSKGKRRAWIRGDMIAPISQQRPPYWRHNLSEKMLMLSSYHLSEQSAPAYLESLSRFDPCIIQAYPSSIGFLAAYLAARQRTYEGTELRGIVTSSESLSGTQRETIERAFGCRVFDWYGQFERVAAIGTCEQGVYHVMDDYSFVEFLPAIDEMTEIVGTGFNNFVMPLIRYRTGDLVELAPEGESCRCGRNFRIVRRIQGRADDVVKLADGRHIGRLDHIFKGVDGILEAQVRQEDVNSICLLVVPGAGFGSQTERRLLENARERLGWGVAIELRVTEAIPRTANGKFRGVVSNV